MKTFIKFKVWPVVAGLLLAFIVMMIFEYINSLIYPLPQDLDLTDTKAIQAFTASLPWTAYILVFLGWITAAFKAGYLSSYLAKESTYKLAFITGLILTILGVVNNALIGHSTFFNIIGLPMFIVFTYLGHKYFLKHQELTKIFS